MKKIAIVGAGMTSLTLSSILRKKFNITIFEKSRGVGGRMSTRRAEPYFFNHGAQYFKINNEKFRVFKIFFMKILLDHGMQIMQ